VSEKMQLYLTAEAVLTLLILRCSSSLSIKCNAAEVMIETLSAN